MLSVRRRPAAAGFRLGDDCDGCPLCGQRRRPGVLTVARRLACRREARGADAPSFGLVTIASVMPRQWPLESGPAPTRCIWRRPSPALRRRRSPSGPAGRAPAPAAPVGRRASGHAGPAERPALKSARSSVLFLTFFEVTELFLSCGVPTVSLPSCETAATLVPVRLTSSARQAITVRRRPGPPKQAHSVLLPIVRRHSRNSDEAGRYHAVRSLVLPAETSYERAAPLRGRDSLRADRMRASVQRDRERKT